MEYKQHILRNNSIFQHAQNINKKSGMVYIFANLFNAWFNRRQLDFYVCFCVHSVAITQDM